MATSTEIADKIAEEHSLTKAQAKSIVDSMLQSITDAAVAGEEVSLPGFGKFKIKETAERDGRNPSTGEAIKIAAAKKITFTPAKTLKDAVNN